MEDLSGAFCLNPSASALEPETVSETDVSQHVVTVGSIVYRVPNPHLKLGAGPTHGLTRGMRPGQNYTPNNP